MNKSIINKNCDPATCGCCVEISNLKRSDKEQWESMEKINNRQDKILTRINIVLGGIAASCVLLLINMIIKSHGGP